MRNAKEHKKLLEQIAELERDSVNYFDVEREFFLITSDNLSAVQTRFYGYSIQASGIYEEDNLTEEAIAGLDGRGCYVYVEARDGQITIKQDLNGCWGIYLFRHGNYFALSNSFFRLLDHVKFRYPLTVNRDYCHYILTDNLCSIAHSETVVNEIQIVDRSTIIHIDTVKKTLETEFIDYREYSISLDLEEGIAVLDSWVEFWGKVFRGLAQHTKFIQVYLSGGFDTRVSLAIFLNSGVDLNNVRIYSLKDDLHTHVEDYEIATQIANHYGFKLNKPLPPRKFLNYNLSDVFNSDLYANQSFSNIAKLWSQKSIDKVYRIGGAAGETIRRRWQIPPIKFIERQSWKVNPYSMNISQEILAATEHILKSGFRVVCDKHNIENLESTDIPQYLYYETWSRHHFGKDSVCNWLMNNVYLISPVLDPEVRTLRLYTAECPDANLLIALLFTRYAPDLLKFPLDLNRSIEPETITYAQKLNERFPRRLTPDEIMWGGGFNLQPRDTRAEKILAEGRNNNGIPRKLLDACLKAVFDSSRTYGLFTTYFDAELYNYAANYYDTKVFGYSRFLHGIVGVTRVLEDVEISQRYHLPYRDMQRFIEQDFCKVPAEDDAAQIIERFSRYFTARVDIKLETAGGDFQIVSVSDDKAKVSKPDWFNKDGIGYVIQSYSGKLEIVAKATVDGQVLLSLKGLDMRNADKSKHVPYWVDYTALTVNGKTIFDTLTPAWHNKSYRHTIDVKAGEEIKLQVEWLPHRSDT